MAHFCCLNVEKRTGVPGYPDLDRICIRAVAKTRLILPRATYVFRQIMAIKTFLAFNEYIDYLHFFLGSLVKVAMILVFSFILVINLLVKDWPMLVN